MSKPKYFFMTVLSIITLFSWVSGFTEIIDQYINMLFSTRGNWFDGYVYFILRWLIALLLISFPVYVYTVVALANDQQLNPEKHHALIKKWSCYFILFLTALLLMFRIGALFYTFLGNEMSVRAILINCVWMVVLGAVCYFYFCDLNDSWNNLHLKKILWVAAAVVAITIIYGIYLIKAQTKPTPLVSTPIGTRISPISAPPVPIAVSYSLDAPIHFCKAKTLVATAQEEQVLQRLLPGVAALSGCVIGNNCVLKWMDRGTTKFSIAWKAACGLGEGSTFVCETVKGTKEKEGKVCCWPLGYQGMVCS